MANCKYTIYTSGKVVLTFDSYTDLLNYVEEILNKSTLDNLSDIVYSKNAHQDSQIEKIKKLRIEYKTQLEKKENNATLINGEPETNGAYSILDFIDSKECAINGRPLVTPLNREDFIENVTKQLMEDKINPISEKEAREIVEKTVEHWDAIKDDAFVFHKLFTNKNVYDVNAEANDFVLDVRGILPDRLKNKSYLLDKLFKDLKSVYITQKGSLPESKGFSNVNLKSKIKGYDTEILGHIDWLFIGEDGTLHIYLFKTCAEDPKYWTKVKKDKYKLQLAFLKAMLADNGINVKNASLNIIPVELKYDEDSNEIVNVHVHRAEVYSTSHTNKYALLKYENQAKAFISDNSIPNYISSDPIKRADVVNSEIFPNINIRSEGIGQSATTWIKYAPNVDPNGTEPLVIRAVDEPDHAYEVIINKKVHNIKSAKPKENNKEIYDLVNKYVKELDDNKGYATQRLKEAINNSYKKGFTTFDTSYGLVSSSTTLNSVLSKYFKCTTDPTTNTKIYEWELLDNLIDANVLVFRHKDTNVVDVITLTAFDLSVIAKFPKGDNILGNFRANGQYNDLKGDYGNIEIVRTMELINEILPKLGDVTLGTVGVLSSINGASFRKFDIGQFNKNYFQEIINTVNLECPDLKIQNNFKYAKFVDPIESIINLYLQIIEHKSNQEIDRYNLYGFDELTTAMTKDQQLKALQYIMTLIINTVPQLANPTYFEQTLSFSKNLNDFIRNLAILYDLVTRAYLHLSGETPKYQNSLDAVERNFYTAATVPDPNIRIIVNNMQITHDTIASEFLDTFDKNVRKHFVKFYEESGYTSALNLTIGNQAQLYNNLFERDIMTGKNLMTFKNPYDLANDLKPHERELLKEILYMMALITHNGKFNYTSANDPKLPNYIKTHPEYLWVPLERASKATSRQSGKAIVAKMKNSWKRILKANEMFDEFINGITPEERGLLGNDSDDFYKLSLKNPFELSMPLTRSQPDTYKSRQAMLEKYGAEFFETNVENIMIDYLAQAISTKLLNKFLVTSKALLLQLHLTGNFAGNESVVNLEIKYIQDYLKVNVFKTTIMSSTEKRIVSAIQPVKSVVTNMLLGGNVISMFRDVMEGALQNFIRSAIKLNTDISPDSVRKAYQYVMTHATSNAMAVNLLSKFCLKYRLSNTDVSRITERAKSGRNGIFNYDNWLYGTLRSPDFLNRMTLFVAKCMDDGVWDAYSIDNDENLKYNWKEDGRFKIYATNQTNHPEYKKQKALYFSKIREYNMEHPESPIEPDGDLPTPYTDREIMSIRAVADNIYGSYDRGKKAMAENHSLGILFGMFTTWMNGIVNTYAMKPLKNGVSRLQTVLETNDQGEKLYYDKDGQILTLEEGGDINMPVTKEVPVLVQGIFYTILDIVRICRNDGRDAVKKYMEGNIVAKSNIRKLISDLLLMLFFNMLFKLALTPGYKEYKKDMSDNPVAMNLMVEILYKASSRSYDQYAGLLNVVEYFGENMNPPYYTIPVLMFKEAGAALIGEKSWKYLLFDNTGLTRSVKDTAFSYLKSEYNV